MKTFDVSFSATHRVGKTLTADKWPEDLCVYTLRLFPGRIGNTLPSLSFIAPFSTGIPICKHIHEEKALIAYLHDKESAAHICSLCKIGGKKAKLEKPDEHGWKRPGKKGRERRFTTKFFRSAQKFREDQIALMTEWCGGLLKPLGEKLLKNSREDNHNVILAFDITEEPRSVVGFAVFSKNISKPMRISSEDLKDIFDQANISLEEADDYVWEGVSLYITDYVLFDRKTRYDAFDDTEEYQKAFDKMRYDLAPHLNVFQDSFNEVVEWMLTVDSEKLRAERKASLYIPLICADPASKRMGIAKGIFRHLEIVAKEFAEKNHFDDVRMKLQPADQDLREMYISFGFDQAKESKLETLNLFDTKLKLEN